MHSTVKPPTPVLGNDAPLPAVETQLATAARLGYHFGPLALGPGATTVLQPKLRLGPVDDPYEQEADRTADAVVQRLNAPGAAVQRQPEGEEDEAIQPKRMVQHQATPAEDDEVVQPKLLLQRQPMPEDEDALQRQAAPAEEDEQLQAKALVQRQSMPDEDEDAIQRQSAPEADDELVQTKSDLQRQSAPEEEDELQTKALQRQPMPDEDEDTLQRQAAPEEDDEQVQAKSLLQRQAAPGDDDDKLQRAPASQTVRPSGGGDTVEPSLEASIRGARGGGQPLAAAVRRPLEQHFGTDFSQVKIHTDGRADTLNRSLQARAFTTGQDLFFRQGEYNPQSTAGQQLLAHELTHVIQQGTGRLVQRRERDATLQLSQPGQLQAKLIQRRVAPAPATAEPTATPAAGEAEATTLPTPEERAAALAKAATARANAAQVQSQNQATSATLTARADSDTSAAQAATQALTAKVAAPTAEPAPAPATAGETTMDEATGEASAELGGEAQPATVASPTAPASNGSSKPTTPVEAAPSTPQTPESDPAFQGVVAKVKQGATKSRRHAPAAAKAKEAQAAAVSPPSELAGQAQSNQVGEMAGAETPGFDAAGFKAKLMDRIEALTPKNAKDADEFKEQNKAGTLKDELQGETAAQQEQAQAPLATATAKPPDASAVPPKPSTPLQPNAPGPAPAQVAAAGAAPKAKSSDAVEAPLAAQSQQLDEQMATANVTEAQLANSNEPEFQAAVSAKQESQAFAQSGPAAYRQAESDQLTQAQAQASTSVQGATTAMHTGRAALLGQVDKGQTQGKSDDEKARAEVGTHIQQIYTKTQSKVTDDLRSLDTEVDQLFKSGAERAKATFESYVDQEMDAYKEERYGGLLGWGQWVIDRFEPTQPEVLAIFRRGRQTYITAMDAVIDNIVALIGRKLTEAKAAIADAKQEIQSYVAGLAPNLQQVGQAAAQNIQSQFDQLEQDVNGKQDELIDKLANQYNEQLQAVDKRVEELNAANATLYDKAADFVGGVIQTILDLKNMLAKLAAKVAGVVETIINDPIGFLGNLVAGVKQGLTNFTANIGTHLQNGLIAWLTGTIAKAGITLPTNWDLPGIFQFVMQLLGLGFETIIGKLSQLFGFDLMTVIEPVKQVIEIYQAEGFGGLVKAGLARLIGEENMQSLLEVWELIQHVISGSWGALWARIQEHISGLQEMVFGKIKEFLSERVIKAGITWIIGLLNPAGAFIKACKAIYDIVIFFIERGSQIMTLVNAIFDSLGAIAGGNLSAAAGAIENVLAKGIPVAIGFLASLLGLGNVSEKVQEIIQGVRGLIDKGLNAIFNSKPVQWVVGFIKRVIGKIRNIVKRGINKVKGAMSHGKDAKDSHDDKQLVSSKSATHKKNFSLSGKDHTLTAIAKSEDISFYMASNRNYALLFDLPPILHKVRENQKGSNPKWSETEFKEIEAVILYSIKKIEEIDLEWNNLQKGEYLRASNKATFVEIKTTEVIELLLRLNGVGIKELDDLLIRLGRKNGPYSYLSDPPGWGPKKQFSDEQRRLIMAINFKNNQGKYISDISSKDPYGKTPIPAHLVHIDHMRPRSWGGSNSYSNAQLVSSAYNTSKQDKWED